MEKRYKGLRFLGTLYKILGVIMLVITILAAVGICGTSILGAAGFETIGREIGADVVFVDFIGSVFGGIMVALVLILYGGFISLAAYAFGEGIYLLLAVEENTRNSTLLLQRQVSVVTPPPQTQAPSQQPAATPDPPIHPPDQPTEGGGAE